MIKWIVYGVILFVFVGADIATKQIALQELEFHQTQYAFGFFPLTLTLNTGGGFSLSFGELSKYIFPTISIIVFVVLFFVYRGTPVSMRFRLLAIALISAGAIGNLIDRLRWELGVVDFIGPVDLGFMLWPIFNIADMAVSVGGVLLVITFWREETPAKSESVASTNREEPALSEEHGPSSDKKIEEI